MLLACLLAKPTRLMEGGGEHAAPRTLTSQPVPQLFQKCCLVQRILEAWEANDHTQ